MPFRNFSIWRGRLPHWRADDVEYYVTFRHRRPLTEQEQGLLLNTLIKAGRSKATLQLICVLPDETELVITMGTGRDGATIELSDVVEGAKRRTGKAIIKASGERFPPFYEESYDRIIRDEQEFEERWAEIVAKAPEGHPFLWMDPALEKSEPKTNS